MEPVLELEIHLYQEEKMEVLSDVYGVEQEIHAMTSEVQLKSLLVNSNGKCKIAEHTKIEEEQMPMYQLIHSEGEIQVEEQAVVENGIAITGTLTVTTLYLSTDGQKSLYATTNLLPFQYVLETENITPTSVYKLHSSIEQLTVTMLDSTNLDVKAALLFRAVVFSVRKSQLITDIKVEELDMNRLSELPGMVIYIAGPGDTLWDIGKRYYVPIAQLKEVNELPTEEINPGDKILVVKGSL